LAPAGPRREKERLGENHAHEPDTDPDKTTMLIRMPREAWRKESTVPPAFLFQVDQVGLELSVSDGASNRLPSEHVRRR
jgi:hypothetical protein